MNLLCLALTRRKTHNKGLKELQAQNKTKHGYEVKRVRKLSFSLFHNPLFAFFRGIRNVWSARKQTVNIFKID